MTPSSTAPASSVPTVPQRAFEPLAQRLLIVGLDGATFDVLDPLMAEGRMPRLRQAIEGGVAGPLRSTTPPITPAAWTTFLTGRQPGSHGILDFERYDAFENKLHMNSTRMLRAKRTVWDVLGERGFKVGSVNVPMTYPPWPINGFMISGFETPSVAADFAYPPELKPLVLERWADPTLGTNWRRRPFGGDRLFAANVDYMAESFRQGAAMTQWLGDRFGWDVLMVVLKLVDNLQHKAWKYLDPRWATRDTTRREIARTCFAALDEAVGTLLDYAASNGAMVLIVSDHGHGSLEGQIQVNRLLQQWGYLMLRGGAQGITRLRHVVGRARGKTNKFAREDDVARDLAVDFERTRACVMHAGMAGFLYVNLRGRQPKGIVEPADYESLRDELRARFLGNECRAVDSQGRTMQLFVEAHKPEALYGVTRDDQPWLPDLILVPHDGLAVVRRIRGREPVRWLPYRRLEGTHRPDGIIIGTGPGIARGGQVRAHIVDCAPTMLAMLGLRVPDDMEGRVIVELFDRSPIIEREAATLAVTPLAGDGAFSADELQKVKARLADLGYLQ